MSKPPILAENDDQPIMLSLIKQILEKRDVPSAILFLAIASVCVWILCLPISTQVQDAYLKRFHLASPNYLAWSAQQIVPAMYNLENRYWYDRQPLSEDKTFDNPIKRAGHNFHEFETGMVNHFPTRKFTFGDARTIHNDNVDSYLYLRSRYRGREIRSSFRMTRTSPSEISFKRTGWEIE